MLDKLTAVLQYRAPDEWVSVMGEVRDEPSCAVLAPMAQARPSAKRHEKGMAITIPMGQERWIFWILSEVPPVNDLAALMARLQDLSRGLDRLAPANLNHVIAPGPTGLPANDAATADFLGRLKSGAGKGARLKPAAFAASVLDQLVELGAIEGGALLRWRGPGHAKIWLSDSRYHSHRQEIGLVASAARTEAETARIVPTKGHAPEDLEVAVLAGQFDAPATALVLPSGEADGYGILGFGATEADLPLLRAAADLCAIHAPVPSLASMRHRWLRRAVAAAVVGALAVWLSLPAPLAIATTGESVGGAVSVSALPGEGYLRAMHVRVGDTVTPGQLLAEFDSPALQEMLAEERLKAAVEQLNAQAALAENRYGDYQLATSRVEIANTRIAQIGDRLEGLRVKATATGRVINALPDSVLGAFVQTGEEIVAIQTSDRMLLRLRPARLDARLVTPGMTGEVYFRGLSDKSYGLRVLTPPNVITDTQTNTEHFEVMAEVEMPEGVIIGMAGFARLDGPEAPRFMGYGRYALEFLREKSWTYLGLRF